MPKVLTHALPALLAAVAISSPAGATSRVSFPAGSIIIPTQANFQTACGMVSAYGLVYNIMRANWSLDPTNNVSVAGCPAGGCHRVTVHWTYSPFKNSPNRCVPTDQDVPPKYAGVLTSPTWNDSSWNDGCDARIVNTAGAPVKLIDNSSGDPSNDTTLSTYSTCSAKASSAACSTYITANGNVNPEAPPLSYGNWGTGANQTTNRQVPNLAWPQYPAQSIGYTAGNPKNVTSVGYLGGAFVISAADAPVALRLISGQLTGVKDQNGNGVDMNQYVVKPAATGIYCNIDATVTPATFFLDTSGTPAHMTSDLSPNLDWYGIEHHVNIHRAMVPFSAYDAMQINSTPLRIALLQTAGGIYANSSSTSSVVGDMLPKYLKSAGLDYPGAHGCPTSSVNAADTSLCPNGAQHGQIYDSLDVLDLTSSNDPLNHPASALDTYGVAWLPHWDGNSFTKDTNVNVPIILNTPPTPAHTKKVIATCNASCVRTAIQNVSKWTRSGQVGLLAECGSLGLFEGAIGNLNFTSAIATPGNALLTCSSINPATGLCDSTPGASMVQGLRNIDSGPNLRRNCTDPDLAASSGCIFHGFPGSPFAQIGDYVWKTRNGLISEFQPNTGGTYRPGTNPLAFTIAAVDKTKLDTFANARAQMFNDNFTYMTVDNDSSKGRVIYLGGHTYSSDVAGTRVVLNSILALGLLPVTGETGFSGGTPYSYYNNNVAIVTPTYDRVTTTGAPAAWNTYQPISGSQWFFPYHTGHLRALNGTTITSGSTTGGYSGLSVAAGFSVSDAAAQLATMLPANRNVFTYLGGVPTKNPSLGNGKVAPNGVLQTGWTPVDIHANSIGTTTSTCLDLLSINQVCGKNPDGTSNCKPTTLAGTAVAATKPGYTGAPYAGMVPGANGACDLQEALALTITPADLGSDFGSSEQTAIKNKLIDPNAVRDAQELLMMMRGFCYSTSTGLDGSGTVPASWPGRCNNPVGWQNPHLGALVRSQPTVVGPSTLIPDAPSGKVRPTVAYVGGWDGMLHAFYLPSSADGSDVSGYTGPAQATTPINPNASSTFHSTFGGSSGFASSTLPLIELWAFVPPGQLPYVKTNSARVDSTPAVLDVYGDFDGSGTRSWHTVLVASAGDANREIFALDVTNPLAPVMLWEINSGSDPTQPYAPVVLSDDDTGIDVSVDTQAILWQNACVYGTTGCTPASFNLPPATDAGRSSSGPYNYQHLGASQSINAALMRRHNVPVYTAFVATNQGDGPGLFVFALDVVTGQKIWEFANPYTPPFNGVVGSTGAWPTGQTDRQAGVGNTAPAGVAVASLGRTGLIDTIYVGDDMGRLWELDAINGVNRTAFTQGCSAAGACNYPLSDAYGSDTYNAQPISTVPTLFYLPSDLTTGNFKSHAGELMLSYGTAGTDTVASIDSSASISGVAHLISLSPTQRLLPSAATGALTSANATTASTSGAAFEVGPFALSNGERLYGAITALGQYLFFATTLGSVTDIDKRGSLGGNTYKLDLGAASLTAGVKLDSSTSGVITGLGGAGGAPLILYGAGSTYGGNVPSGLNGVKVITVTDQTVGVYTMSLSAAATADVINTKQQLGAVVGKAAGGTGTLRRFGWLWRTLGIEY